jgi:hypothetical protein
MQAVASTRVGDMSNTIHAMFKRSNFRNITDAEYNALKPSLQFVSLFLTTPELAGFPHAILVNAIKHSHPDKPGIDERSFEEKAQPLSAHDMAEYGRALATLADCTIFEFGDVFDLHTGCTQVDRSVRLQNTHLYYGCLITISKQDLDHHVNGTYPYPGDFGVKCRTFETAKALLHELMHAMAYARLGDLEDIPFGSNKVLEIGYEWEAHVFGGICSFSALQNSGLANNGSLMISDWPAPSITRWYKHEGFSIGIRKEPLPVEMRWWLLPTEWTWFYRLFTTDFWRRIVPLQGLSALKPPRRRGYRAMVAEDGNVTMFDRRCQDASSYDCVIPAGYIELADGNVVESLFNQP